MAQRNCLQLVQTKIDYDFYMNLNGRNEQNSKLDRLVSIASNNLSPYRFKRCASIRHVVLLLFQWFHWTNGASRWMYTRHCDIHAMRFVSFIRIRFFIINNRRPKNKQKLIILSLTTDWPPQTQQRNCDCRSTQSRLCVDMVFVLHIGSYLERIRSNSCVIAPCLNPSQCNEANEQMTRMKFRRVATIATNSFLFSNYEFH